MSLQLSISVLIVESIVPREAHISVCTMHAGRNGRSAGTTVATICIFEVVATRTRKGRIEQVIVLFTSVG